MTRFVLAVLLLTMIQGCARGFFTTAQSSSNEPSSLGSSNTQIKIVNATAGTPYTLENLTFQISSAALSPGVDFLWSHALVLGSGQLQSCTELNSHDRSSYSLNCSQAGILQISVTVSSQGTILASDSVSWTLQEKGIPSQPPTPTPAPTPVPPSGASLYAKDCQSCHGALASNRISNRSLSGIENAIQQVGSMRSLSGLSNAEILAISNSLNGN